MSKQNTDNIIFLLYGFSESGKDYAGLELCKKYNFVSCAFADTLKNFVSKKYNIPLERFYSHIWKQTLYDDKRTYRQLLIEESKEYRNKDLHFFSRLCCEKIKGNNRIVITDMRFPSELFFIKEYFKDYKIIPLNIIRLDQIKSPVNDISEYLITSDVIKKAGFEEKKIINTLDNSFNDNIKLFLKLNNIDLE